MAISINPVKQTCAAGSFNIESTGLIVGVAQADPVARFSLVGGVLDASETLPMYGGVAISEVIAGASGGPRAELGPIVKRATQSPGSTPAAGDITGFCVFDQAHAMIQSAESAVPQAAPGMSVNFYRLGSRARVALAISPELAALLPGQIMTRPLAWDFANQRLCPVSTAGSPVNITAATWASGLATLTVASDMTARLSAGSPVIVAGVTPPAWNGVWTIVSITATTIVVNMPSNPGSYTSGGTADEVSTATVPLPVKVEAVYVGNSMVPVYDALTGFVNWNRAGSAAVVII
ncbi:MAG: hypothetical protein N2444_00240 [Methylocystis sp.]|nr:hypothetical protein [Methylocystis sp.]